MLQTLEDLAPLLLEPQSQRLDERVKKAPEQTRLARKDLEEHKKEPNLQVQKRQLLLVVEQLRELDPPLDTPKLRPVAERTRPPHGLHRRPKLRRVKEHQPPVNLRQLLSKPPLLDHPRVVVIADQPSLVRHKLLLQVVAGEPFLAEPLQVV